MRKQPGPFCPLIKKNCVGEKCAWYTHIRGTNPQTGEELDEQGCAIAWTPILLVENANMSRQTGAAVESLRNEVSKTQQDVVRLRQDPIDYIGGVTGHGKEAF